MPENFTTSSQPNIVHLQQAMRSGGYYVFIVSRCMSGVQMSVPMSRAKMAVDSITYTDCDTATKASSAV